MFIVYSGYGGNNDDYDDSNDDDGNNDCDDTDEDNNNDCKDEDDDDDNDTGNDENDDTNNNNSGNNGNYDDNSDGNDNDDNVHTEVEDAMQQPKVWPHNLTPAKRLNQSCVFVLLSFIEKNGATPTLKRKSFWRLEKEKRK